MRRLVTPYVLVAIRAILLIAIGTALATSFGGTENADRLHASLQEDRATSETKIGQENEATSETETTTDKKAQKGGKTADKRQAGQEGRQGPEGRQGN